jgi:hypothetical protein
VDHTLAHRLLAMMSCVKRMPSLGELPFGGGELVRLLGQFGAQRFHSVPELLLCCPSF